MKITKLDKEELRLGWLCEHINCTQKAVYRIHLDSSCMDCGGEVDFCKDHLKELLSTLQEYILIHKVYAKLDIDLAT